MVRPNAARRSFVTGLSLAIMAAPVRVTAQAGKVYRIGVMFPRAHTMFPPLVAALADRGWVDGRNIAFEFRGGAPPSDADAPALVGLKVDVIVTILTGRAVAARGATSTIPIVMMTSGYPVEAGLVKSYARPGGNVTGNSIYAGTELFGKHVEILKTIQPRMSRLAVLWGYVPPVAHVGEGEMALEELTRAANKLGMEVVVWKTPTREETQAALAVLSQDRADGLYVTGSPAHADSRTAERIAQVAVERRMPSMSDFAGPGFAAGLLVTYSAGVASLARQTAGFVDRILRGAAAADLPIERPSKFDLVINMKTAKALGLTIPPSLLLRADQVIE
jgi:putative tryptophan/tyrosine transport system substrate-binding protein